MIEQSHVHGSFLKSHAWFSDPQHFDLDASTDHLLGQMSDRTATAHPAIVEIFKLMGPDGTTLAGIVQYIHIICIVTIIDV